VNSRGLLSAMIKYYTADYIFPVSSDPVKNGVVAVDEDGQIAGLFQTDSTELSDKPIEKLSGIIVPGFVNSHCHLELSHLYQKIDKHQGLVPFVREVISQRAVDKNLCIETMEYADKTMAKNGIVAVGDISNTDISRVTKEQSSIYYHTYIELIGIQPQKAKDVMNEGLNLKRKFNQMPSSIVPHSPYSVCKPLFREIRNLAEDGSNLLSIHNQESKEENKLYRYKNGQFIDFYKQLNLNIDYFRPSGRSSLQTILPLLYGKQSLMLVHNTYTNLKDIYFTRRINHDLNITWCFCPNANLFIEDHLPKIAMFLFDDFNITLGTDSLASNDELCILSELKTLHANFPELPFSLTIAWATLNGARFLSVDDRFGSIEKGKKPGLNLISNVDGLNLTPNSKVKKIV
jgi:cytosine/adenosine deaminase-related metal-dependent hydrolase